MNNKLWNRDFTILTLGTFVSMLGSSITWYTLGLIVFDNTNSTFLYSLVGIVWQIPNFVFPLVAGVYLDRFSRRKAIYILDFLNAFIFLIATFLLFSGHYNYLFILFLTFIVGVIGCFYNVAYESFFPTLISEGNYQKAYSISSLMYPLTSALMMPIAANVYVNYGPVPLLAFNAISFFLAAVMETFMKAPESHLQDSEGKNIGEAFGRFFEDIKEGVQYLSLEKGLLAVTLYFGIGAFSSNIVQQLYVPFFSTTPGYSIVDMSNIMAFSSGARVVGGLLQYYIKYPKQHKFTIAIIVYSAIEIINIIFFFSPVRLMMFLMVLTGLLGITSYNIRISATHSYVPNDKRGRFNGIFMMITSVGGLLGGLTAGVLGEKLPIHFIVIGSALLNLSVIYLILIRNKEAVKQLYNRES